MMGARARYSTGDGLSTHVRTYALDACGIFATVGLLIGRKKKDKSFLHHHVGAMLADD
jgi:hypothetical protein